jgi:hypothetical protein
MQRNWTADEDGQLLEMLRIDCHRAIIAKALERTEMEIRARIGVLLKALQGENSGPVWRQADEMSLL